MSSTFEEQFNEIQARRETATERVKSLRRTAKDRQSELEGSLPVALAQWALGTINDDELRQKMLDMAIVSQFTAISQNTLETAVNQISNICNRDTKKLKKLFKDAGDTVS
jgi:hypothetical protein